MASSKVNEWTPARYALRARNSTDRPGSMILLILNQPINDLGHFRLLHQKALQIICADGGLNRVYELPLESEEKLDGLPPISVCGDMDSLRSEVEKFFRSKTVNCFYKDSDKYSTDFMKCLKYIDSIFNGEYLKQLWSWSKFPSEKTERQKEWFQKLEDLDEKDKAMPPPDIVVMGSLDGRLDQGFSTIHHLYKASEMRSSRIGNTYLVTAESISFLLEKGLNRISTPVGPGLFTENIGIIPVGRPSIITTRGLEWDVTDWPTEFGTKLSTSNHIKADTVEVETTEKVLFTVELAPREPRSGTGGSFVRKSIWTWVED